MTRIKPGVAAEAPPTPEDKPAPRIPPTEQAERVIRAVLDSADPQAVLRIGHPTDLQKGFRVLAMRLHPDRLGDVRDSDKPRVEEAFKLAKAAWEATPTNPAYSKAAADYYATARVKARELRAPPPAAAAEDAFGAEARNAEAKAAAETFRRQQAEAAEQAAKAAREGAERARESALANARMILEGLRGGLPGNIDQLKSGLDAAEGGAASTRAAALAKAVASMPLTFVPPFDPRHPTAQKRLETFKTQTVEGLREAYAALPEFERELPRIQESQGRLTRKLGVLRQSLADAHQQVTALREHGAPAAEVEQWRSRMVDFSREVDALAKALKNETHHVAELNRHLGQLRTRVPFALRQVHEHRVVESAEQRLMSTFNLSRADFGKPAAAWKARIALVSGSLEKRITSLTDDLVAGTRQARNASFNLMRYSLVISTERTVKDAQRLEQSFSEDVKNALSPELRTRLDALFADFAAIGAAKTERAKKIGPPVPIATRVTGLSDPTLEKAWNTQVDFAINFEKRQEEARWAGRDPTRFYSS